MFKLRGVGISRGRSRQLFGVVVTCGLVLQLTTLPVSAGGRTSDLEGGVGSPEHGQVGATPSDGPENCSVSQTEKERVGRVVSNIDGTQSTSLYDDNLPYDYTPPEIVDEDPSSNGPTGNDDSFFREVVDGQVTLGDIPYTVYEVTGCDGYAPGQVEVVFAPPSAASYIPAAEDLLKEILPIPTLEFTPFDEENDWTYVQAPIDFRTDAASIAPVSFLLDSGGPDFVGGVQIRRWMVITAEPSAIFFDSGDPLAEDTQVECTPEEALAPYVEETPGACSYRFLNGSSVTESNRFDAELRVEWDVTFTRNDGPPGTMDIDPTINFEEIAVAEVKAVTRLTSN